MSMFEMECEHGVFDGDYRFDWSPSGGDAPVLRCEVGVVVEGLRTWRRCRGSARGRGSRVVSST